MRESNELKVEEELTLAGMTGVERMRAMAQTMKMTLRQLLMVQSERDRIGKTITMNLDPVPKIKTNTKLFPTIDAIGCV